MWALHEGVWIISVALALCNEVRPVPRGLGEWNYEKHARSAPPSQPPAATTPAVLGDFTHHYSIRQETAVAKFSSGRLGAQPPPPVGRSPIVRCPEAGGRKRRGRSLRAARRWNAPRPLAKQIPPSSRIRPFLGFPLGGTCRPRATLPEAAGPLGRRRPGKPRRDPCPFPCTEREHGGTQAVSHRSGSPREARREGPNVLLLSSLGMLLGACRCCAVVLLLSLGYDERR